MALTRTLGKETRLFNAFSPVTGHSHWREVAVGLHSEDMLFDDMGSHSVNSVPLPFHSCQAPRPWLTVESGCRAGGCLEFLPAG